MECVLRPRSGMSWTQSLCRNNLQTASEGRTEAPRTRVGASGLHQQNNIEIPATGGVNFLSVPANLTPKLEGSLWSLKCTQSAQAPSHLTLNSPPTARVCWASAACMYPDPGGEQLSASHHVPSRGNVATWLVKASGCGGCCWAGKTPAGARVCCCPPGLPHALTSEQNQNMEG